MDKYATNPETYPVSEMTVRHLAGRYIAFADDKGSMFHIAPTYEGAVRGLQERLAQRDAEIREKQEQEKIEQYKHTSQSG